MLIKKNITKFIELTLFGRIVIIKTFIFLSRPTYYYISSRFSRNSDLFENLEGISLRYYLNSDVTTGFKSSTTHWCATRDERVEIPKQKTESKKQFVCKIWSRLFYFIFFYFRFSWNYEANASEFQECLGINVECDIYVLIYIYIYIYIYICVCVCVCLCKTWIHIFYIFLDISSRRFRGTTLYKHFCHFVLFYVNKL